jgi:hypothetical protein
MAVARLAFGQYLSGQHVEGSEQRGRAMPFIAWVRPST